MTRSRANTSKKVVAKVDKLQKTVNRIQSGIEKNIKDTVISKNISYDVDNATHLSALTFNGDGSAGTRQGRKVKPMFIEIRGMIDRPVDASLQSNTPVRVMIVQSRQRFKPVTNAAAGLTNILAPQNSNTTAYAPFDHNNRKHFSVLYDKTFMSGFNTISSGFTDSWKPSQYINIRKKVSRNIVYEDDSNTVLEGGHIYLCLYSNIISTQAEPTFDGICRLTYTDM